jgi:hypothetical protein
MASAIPLDANFKNLSCQLGGLRLNGIVNYNDPTIHQGTAESITVITIDDSSVAQEFQNLNPCGKFLRIKISDQFFYLPLYTELNK